MVTDQSGAPKGRVFVWRGSPRAKSTRLAGLGTLVHRQADAPHATTSSRSWAVPAARVAPVMSWCAARASPACRTGLRRAIGLARYAVRLKRATSPARWSGAAMRWRGSAMVATGSVSRRVCSPGEGEASGLDHRLGQDRSHRLLTPMAGAIRHNPLEPRPVLLGASPLPARASLGLGGSPPALTGLRCVVSACLAMAGAPSIGTVPTTLWSEPHDQHRSSRR